LFIRVYLADLAAWGLGLLICSNELAAGIEQAAG
jgi:hypothetical protein